jgi:steroid delta-isomerase-like uncharacterized protein
MSTEENKARQRRLVEEFINQGNTAVALALVAEDFIGLDLSAGHQRGREGLIDIIARMRTAFPDLEWTIEEQVAEGDKVALYCVWRGTHQGEFLGIPPTGKRVTVPCVNFDYWVAGQCKKSRFMMDTMSLMQQLGVVPPPGQAS